MALAGPHRPPAPEPGPSPIAPRRTVLDPILMTAAAQAGDAVIAEPLRGTAALPLDELAHLHLAFGRVHRSLRSLGRSR